MCLLSKGFVETATLPCPQSVIHDTPGVKRGFLSEETLKDQKMLVLKTDGVNLQVSLVD